MIVRYSCFGKNVKIDVTNTINKDKLDFWMKRFCPDVEITSRRTSDFTITCEDGQTPDYRMTDHNLILKGRWTDSESWLSRIVMQVFQKLLVQDGVVFLQASCVRTDTRRCILIIGDYWQGKTSMAIGLADRMGWDILTDNCVALKDGDVIGWTNYLSSRGYQISDAKEIMRSEGRIFYENQCACNGRYTVSLMIDPHINPSNNQILPIPKNESRWYVYQKLSKCINGDTPMFDGMIPSPITNDYTSASVILREANTLVDSCELLYGCGPMEDVVTKAVMMVTR